MRVCTDPGLKNQCTDLHDRKRLLSGDRPAHSLQFLNKL